MTGLGTPVANLLVPDLIAYQGPGTSYAGSPVGPLQDATLVNTGTSDSGPIDVFSVFDSLTVTGNGFGDAQGQVLSTDLASPMNGAMATAGAGRIVASPVVATGFTSGPASSLSPAGLTPLPPAGVGMTPVATSFISQQPAWSTVQPVVIAPTNSERFVVLQRADLDIVAVPSATKPPTGLVLERVLEELAFEPGLGRSLSLRHKTADSVLDELVSYEVLRQGRREAETIGGPDLTLEQRPIPDFFRPLSSVLRPCGERQSAAPKVWLTDILFAIGFCGYSAGTLSARGRRTGNVQPRRTTRGER